MDIGKTIDSFKGSAQFKKIQTGQAYYDSENTEIMQRKKQFYTESGLATDPYKANNKLASSFYKIIVKQLVGYLLGNGINISSKSQASAVKGITDVLGLSFEQKMSECAVNAVKCSVGWLHPYLDKDGKFKFSVIPSEQVAFKMSPTDEDVLKSVVRFYDLEYNGKKFTKAEVWSDKDVTFYFKEGDKAWAMCTAGEDIEDPRIEMVNPRPHLVKTAKYGDRVDSIQGLGWGKIPFIPMWFDNDKEYQLKPIKRHIDGYDIVQSDFMNNLEDIQDVFWILKGYDGEDLNTFLNDVKKYKAIKVGDDGDARTETTDIPTEAREKMLASLRKDIFFFGMAVDTDVSEGGNITNVVIRSRYANLDLKADDFEPQVRNTIQELIEFVNIYMGMTSGTPLTDYVIEFDRSLIINEVEIMEMVDKQKGIVSDETFYEHHPWTKDDVKKELSRLEDDLEKNPITIPEEEPEEV